MHINISTLPGIFPWKPAAWISVTGPDAATFLQGQFTKDLRGLEPGGGARYGLWLTVKGKVLADSFVLRGVAADQFWVGSYFSPATAIGERLESHLIADEVEVRDVTAEWTGMALLGPAALPSAERGEADSVVTFAGRRERGGGGLEWVFRISAGTPRELTDGGWASVEAVEMERRRITAGIPAIPRDIGPGDLPNEGGLEGEAISFTKGCYLGQEVMARLKAMGQVRRRLVRVAGPGPGPAELPQPLFAGGRTVGEVRSAAPLSDGSWIGLALVSLLPLAGVRAVARTPDGPAEIRLVDAS